MVVIGVCGIVVMILAFLGLISIGCIVAAIQGHETWSGAIIFTPLFIFLLLIAIGVVKDLVH